MKKILIPTDFSKNAYAALVYATYLFKEEECLFYILNTFEVLTPVLTSRIYTHKGALLYEELSKKSKDGLTEVLHSIIRDSENPKHIFETKSVSKDLAETVTKIVKKKEIDYVIMGTKGITGAEQVLFGSNTIKVIKKIKDCPVLIIPEEFDFEVPAEIGFPTDFKHPYLDKELAPLIEIASLFKSNIRIFHINEEEKLDITQESNYRQLKRSINDFMHSMHWVSKKVHKTKHINDFIDEIGINLLVMVNYRHGFMEQITHEPVIKKITGYTRIPFLVIPDFS